MNANTTVIKILNYLYFLFWILVYSVNINSWITFRLLKSVYTN